MLQKPKSQIQQEVRNKASVDVCNKLLPSYGQITILQHQTAVTLSLNMYTSLWCRLTVVQFTEETAGTRRLHTT